MIYQNDRIKVTVPDDCKLSRAEILSQAMSILGHQSELSLVEQETISDKEAIAEAVDQLTFNYLTEPGHCSYDISKFVMRWKGGHRMSEGMLAQLDAARMYAQKEAIENRAEVIKIGRDILEKRRQDDLEWHKRRSNSNWIIEIIGSMPEQIGMCRMKKD